MKKHMMNIYEQKDFISWLQSNGIISVGNNYAEIKFCSNGQPVTWKGLIPHICTYLKIDMFSLFPDDVAGKIYDELTQKVFFEETVKKRCEFITKDVYEIGDVVKVIPYESINQCNPVIGGITWVGDMDKFADTIAVIKNRRTVFSDISGDSTEKVFAYSLEGDEDEWDFSAEMFVGMANKKGE